MAKSQTLDDLYNEAYALVEQGICFDEVGHDEGAQAMYQRGLTLIDEAGRMPNAQKNEHYQKMARAREHIIQRLSALRPSAPSGAAATANVYPQVPSETAFDAISGALMALGDVRQAEELFCVPEGVQIFFIKGEDTTVPSYPTSLKIFKFRDQESNDDLNRPVAFVQVGDWVHPLVPGKSPVLHSTYGAYIFPSPKPDRPDATVGVILPTDLEKSKVQEFEKLMKELTLLKTEDISRQLSDEENSRLSSKLAKLLTKGAEWVCWGLEQGAIKGSDLLGQQAKALQKGEKGQAIQVDPRVQTSVHYLRKGTKVAVKVSGYIVNKLGKIGVQIGKSIAASAEQRVTRSGSGAQAQILHDTIEVASAGVKGAAAVWMGLEGAAKVLAKSIANETVHVVKHRYGDDMSVLTDNAMRSVYNAGATAWNVESLGIKAIAKRTAKETGLAILEDLDTKGKKKRDDDSSASSITKK